MSKREPTFRERIRLLQIAAVEATAIANGPSSPDTIGPRLREVAEIIGAEVARMERAAARWEQRAPRKNAKTAPEGTAITSSS